MANHNSNSHIPFQSAQLFGIVLVNEGLVDIARHHKGPQRIYWHEPAHHEQCTAIFIVSKYSPLDQKCPKLTQRAFNSNVYSGLRDQRCQISHHISEGRIVDQAIDRLLK